MPQLIEVPNYGQVEFPDDMTDDQIVAAIKKTALGYKQPKQITMQDDLRAELEANPISAKFAAAGTALTDLYQGGKQALGMGNAQDIENNRVIRDANPMSALAGNVGLFAAGGAAAPFLNTAKGAALAGGTVGGLAPVQGENVAQQKLGNALLGAGIGGAVTKGAQGVTNALAKSTLAKQTLQAQNTTKDASLKAAQEAGYVIPKSLYDPTFLSNRLESVAGKAATKQAAAGRNTEVTNLLARKSLGLPNDAPLSVNAVEGVRKTAYKPYEEIAGLSKGAANTLEDLKQNRADANAWFNSYNRTANPEHLAKAKELKEVADMAENVLEDYAKNAGKAGLVNDLVKSRKIIAKTYTVQRALNPATGDIDPNVLGRLYSKGKPLSDGLDEIGRFNAAFPQVSKANASIPAAGVSKVEALAMAGLGLGGAYGTDSPLGAAAGLLPLLSHPARSAALSKLLQSTPDYSQKLTPKLLEGLLSSRYAPMALTGGAVPSFTK